jgi:hypothetical protein
MKTWALGVHVIYHATSTSMSISHVNIHVSMSHQPPHQQPCHVHDLIYDECYVTFVMFIYVAKPDPGLGWVGSNLIYDGVEMSCIASI